MHILIDIGFLLLGVLITGLLLIGVLDAVRGTPIEQVGSDEDNDQSPSVSDPGFQETIELFTRIQLKPGHTVDVFTNGDQTYSRLWEDLRGARSSITLQMYYCNAGRMADTLHDILVERARAGVAVYFLYDAFGTSLPGEYFESLHAAGVKTGKFRPLSWRSLQKAQHRAHIRVIVIDATVGYTGGFGIDDKWYGDGHQQDQWRDTSVRFAGPAVQQLQATFAVCWAETCGQLLCGNRLFPVARDTSTEGVVGAVLHASPTIGSTPAERFFVLSIASARERLYITNSYFIPDLAFRQMLCRAAARGVDVRVLTAGKGTDVKSTWYAGRARYEKLLESGVRIFEYQPAMMHAKTIVVDGRWLSIGSMNADNRSMSFNEESNLVVLDEGIGQRMEALFHDDLRYSEEIELATFRKRSWIQRIGEHACHLVWRVL